MKLLLMLLLLTLPIFSQAINSSYAGIEEKIAMGRLDEALKETEAELTEHPADAKLSLFQAKIWEKRAKRFIGRGSLNQPLFTIKKHTLWRTIFHNCLATLGRASFLFYS